MGYLTITDDPNEPVVTNILPIVIGEIEFLKYEPSTRNIARAAVARRRQQIERRGIIERVSERFGRQLTKFN